MRWTMFRSKFARANSLCILGPSGCGKTTLLWSMAGLHTLTAGEIRLGRERIVQPHPEIAMIFQDANLLPWRNLLEKHRPSV